MFTVYITDTEGGEHLVFSFSTRQEAISFMDTYNEENLDYIIREED